jgi:hypothetical protein
MKRCAFREPARPAQRAKLGIQSSVDSQNDVAVGFSSQRDRCYFQSHAEMPFRERRHAVSVSGDSGLGRRFGPLLVFYGSHRRGGIPIVSLFRKGPNSDLVQLDVLVSRLQIRAVPYDSRAKADFRRSDAGGTTRRIPCLGGPMRR